MLSDALMTPEEVADLLRIPVSTLYAWRYRSEGPRAHKVGRHLRWDPAEVARWLDTRVEGPDAEPANA